MLEDNFTDVLRKALLGHALTPAAAAMRAGIAETELLGFLGGAFSAETARVMGNLLGLNAQALANHPTYQPAAVAHPGIRLLSLPFNGDHVNAWLIGDGDELVLFDSGADEGDLVGLLRATCGRLPGSAFITHDHRDHVGGLQGLCGAGVPIPGPEGCGSPVIQSGDVKSCGRLRISACDLSGHCVPALGYHVDGIGVPVLVTGDALFAGSMGGCPTPSRYQLALDRLAEVLDPLPDQTILLPGHGPATTLGEERVSNPFLLTDRRSRSCT
jgi:hydroxyacylglutathione hydrolase